MTPLDDFAWVKERSECTVARVFEILRQQVMEDVKVRQGLCAPVASIWPERFSHAFRFLDSSNSFTVLLEGEQLNERVSFMRESRTIKATSTNGDVIIEGTPSLNVEGKCVLKIGAEEQPIWYFRKRALESLFFETGQSTRP
jgi:hypothetical protein